MDRYYRGNVVPVRPRRKRFGLLMWLITVPLAAGAVTYCVSTQTPALPRVNALGAKPACNIKGNINEWGERIYHMPDQDYYSRTKHKPGSRREMVLLAMGGVVGRVA